MKSYGKFEESSPWNSIGFPKTIESMKSLGSNMSRSVSVSTEFGDGFHFEEERQNNNFLQSEFQLQHNSTLSPMRKDYVQDTRDQKYQLVQGNHSCMGGRIALPSPQSVGRMNNLPASPFLHPSPIHIPNIREPYSSPQVDHSKRNHVSNYCILPSMSPVTSEYGSPYSVPSPLQRGSVHRNSPRDVHSHIHGAIPDLHSSSQFHVDVPIESADGHIYQVHFKRAHRNFFLSTHALIRPIRPGDFVKVEADRGEDMGVVISRVPASEFNEFIPTAGYRGRGFSSGQGEKKFIIRLATVEERASLIEKVRDEEKALEVA
jgi:hypothetical protein